METPSPAINLADVKRARTLIASGIRETPCVALPDLPELGGSAIWLKREDLQRTRSFKERGALHGLLALNDGDRERGIVAASAGNHALGLAYHGSRLGIRVTVIMPKNASAVKVSRCRSLGADVVLYGESYDTAQAHATELACKSGRALIHPFDDLAVIAGQGTMALEILEAVPHFDSIVVPVGGGGLLAGVATVVKALRPEIRVIAAQSVHAAGLTAARGQGRPVPIPAGTTLADGIAVARMGVMCFDIASPLVDQVVSVTEEEIAGAISLLARNGVVAEGAGAAALAAVVGCHISAKSVVIPVSGGNIDPRLHERAVTEGAEKRLRNSWTSDTTRPLRPAA
jgi:threonine dehydratase